MSHFARINDNNIVDWVIVAEQNFIDAGHAGPGTWIQTSYNTRSGVHVQGGTPLRKNFAGLGMIYDATRDAFYGPQPYPSWTLNESTCQWEPPTPRPGAWDTWDEATQAWIPGTDPSA